MTIEYGRCAQCAENQPKVLQNCRKCNAPLPWTKGAKKSKSAGSGGSFSLNMGDVAWGGIGVQVLGGIVLVLGAFFWAGNVAGFFPTFPGVGYITMAIGGAILRAGIGMND